MLYEHEQRKLSLFTKILTNKQTMYSSYSTCDFSYEQ